MAASKRTATDRLARLEKGQVRTNAHLEAIRAKVETSSTLFDVVTDRLDRLDAGQLDVLGRLDRLDSGRRHLEEGQRAISSRLDTVVGRLDGVVDRLDGVVGRLDRFFEASTRDRTEWAERVVRVEQRVEAVEHRLDDKR